eukprot:CAMPEP_0196601422 /NCGR_PEP_ID=MMETSP1081-20130531/95900_1 /TAXON_ID=36882 /ORGANISM="Pyramimonas amylifera, Strain CCMP720" /LENGTH=534 /DNA_ID=CAMNT_0041927297 /DNA_START=129 /DNA_END=1730 /DNA_ORIENTATION=+
MRLKTVFSFTFLVFIVSIIALYLDQSWNFLEPFPPEVKQDLALKHKSSLKSSLAKSDLSQGKIDASRWKYTPEKSSDGTVNFEHDTSTTVDLAEDEKESVGTMDIYTEEVETRVGDQTHAKAQVSLTPSEPLKDSTSRSSLPTSTSSSVHRHLCAYMHPNVLSMLDPHKAYQAHHPGDLFMDWVCKRQFNAWVIEVGNKPVKEVMVFADNEETAGLGARMMRVACAFWSTLSRGGAFTSQPFANWLYAPAESECPERNNDCYFQPLTSPANYQLVKEGLKLAVAREGKQLAQGALPSLVQVSLSPSKVSDPAILHDAQFRIGPKISQWTRESLTLFYTKHNRGIDLVDKTGPQFALKSGCWVMGHMQFMLMQANAELDRASQAARADLGFEHPIVAMHVRHGDRAEMGQKGALMGLEKYMKEAKQIAPHVKRILIMTEDQEVIDDTAKFPDYTFVYTKVPRLNTRIGLAIKNGEIDPKVESYNALINLYMAVDSDYFIGGLGSSWARMILMLSYGKYNCMQPHATLGSSWSSKW